MVADTARPRSAKECQRLRAWKLVEDRLKPVIRAL